MYFLTNVNHSGMAAHLTRSDCEGFVKKCCISKTLDETDDDMLWNGSEEEGNDKS